MAALALRFARFPGLTCLAAALFAIASGATAPAAGQEWKTGVEFRRQLDGRASIEWSGTPLREPLMALSKGSGIAVFLDRRIDPGRMIELKVQNEPLSAVIEQIATLAGGRSAIVGSVVYIGPPDCAAKLPALAAARRQEATGLSNNAKSRLLRTKAWRWNELAEPRQLLNELASEATVTIRNPEMVPHDLWPAVSLPSMTWVDRLSLLLVGFDLTFEIAEGGAAVRLVNMPATVAMEKSTTPGGAGRPVISPNNQSAGEKRYTLEVAGQPAGAVVKKVANQLGKELKYDTAVLEILRQEVKFSVKNVTLDELLRKTLQPLGLTYELSDSTLTVIPAT